MKIMNRLYLVDNLTGKDYDKLNCAVIIATCITSAMVYAKEMWPDIEVVIQELNHNFIDELEKIGEVLICEDTINE